MTDFNGSGNGGTVGDGSVGAKAYWIDGNVNNVVGRNWNAANINGEGLLISNQVGNATAPGVVEVDRLRVITSNGRGIDLQAGTGLDLINPLITRSNWNNFVSCASSAGFFVAAGINFWSFAEGGVSERLW